MFAAQRPGPFCFLLQLIYGGKRATCPKSKFGVCHEPCIGSCDLRKRNHL